MRRASIRLMLRPAVVGVFLQAACGARTGLDVPASHDASVQDVEPRDVAVDDAQDASDAGEEDAAIPLAPHIVLFGGFDAQDDQNDTWTFDGVSWTQRAVPGPSAREGAGMSSFGNGAVLFGGFDFGYRGDTWTWDGVSWTPQGFGPPARSDMGMTTLGGHVVMFGGENTSPDLGDTWLWDGATWTQAVVAGPSARVSPSMASLPSEALLFGGAGNFDDAGIGHSLGDAYAWDSLAWTASNAPGPSPRSDAAMTTLGSNVVLFGGFPNFPTPPDVGDTWTWDGNQWTRHAVPGPSPRLGARMATLGGKAYLFGGESADLGTLYDDTWAWDGAAWTKLPAPGPTPRADMAMATVEP